MLCSQDKKNITSYNYFLFISVSDCKEKWKNIRSSYVRSLKQSETKVKRPYYLSSYLRFVLPYLKPLSKSDQNDSLSFQIELESSDNHCERSISPTPSFKIEDSESDEEEDRNVIEEEDPLSAENITTKNAMRYFLLSLLPEFDKMSQEQTRLFKIKTLMLIDEIKSDHTQLKKNLKSVTSNERIQKRLINLLLKNLERK